MSDSEHGLLQKPTNGMLIESLYVRASLLWKEIQFLESQHPRLWNDLFYNVQGLQTIRNSIQPTVSTLAARLVK